MKLYRTVSVKEFTKVMFGEKIEGRMQSGRGCHYYDNKFHKMMIASQKPIKFICTFNENIFWVDDYRQILLTLEIPESRIITKGFGEYNTMIWDEFVTDNNNGEFCFGQFGIKNSYQDGLQIDIEETYIDYYELSDIKNVEFIYESTLPGFGIDSKKIKFEAFDVYDEITMYIKRYRRNNNISRKELKYHYSDIWDSNFNISLSTLKLILKKEFELCSDIFDIKILNNFIKKWSYYKDIKILDKILLKSKYLKTVTNKSLEFYNIESVLDIVSTNDCYFFDNLFEIDKKDETKFNIWWNTFYNYFKSKFQTNSCSWNLDITKKYTYSMLKVANVI